MNSVFTEYKLDFPKTVQIGRFVENAKRPAEIPFSIRIDRPNALRGSAPFSAILQIAQSSVLPSTSDSVATLQPSQLPPCGSLSGSSVCDRSWDWTRREHSVADPQRSDPAASGSARVSSPRHFEELSLALWLQGTAQCGNCSRPTAPGTVPSLRSSPQCDCRCRSHSPVDLRSSRGSRRRLCPQKAPRPTFLCADPLQRRPMWPDSGNGTQSGQCSSHHRSFKLLKANLGQTAFLDCHHPHSTSIGRSLLRQKDHRSYRPGANRLCRFGQDDPSPQKYDDHRSLSVICPGLGSCRIHLYAFSLAKGASVCGCTQSCGFGTRIYSATAFHLQAVHLPPSAGYQFGAHPGGGLAFLLRPGIPGASAARVQGLLYNGQDSNPQLLGQCYLHGDGLVGLRLGLGFPGTLFARGSSTLEHLHLAPRTLVAPSALGQTRQSQCPVASCKVSPPGPVCENSNCRLRGEANYLNRFATL